VFDGIYTLTVSQPTNEDFAGKVISFKIGDFSAKETALWQQGQTNVFNLTASSSVFVTGPSGTSLASPIRAVPLSQAAPPAPPSVFQGTASVDGVLVPQGTTVTAWLGGIEVGSANVVSTPAILDSLTGAGTYFSSLGESLRSVYDPRAGFTATSTLKETFSDQIVWIDVNADVDFRGLILYQGWNFVPLP
jgi:hypothetical protein